MKAMINLGCLTNSKKTLLILGLALTLTACGGGGGGLLGALLGAFDEALPLNLASAIDAGTLSEESAISQLLAAGF